MKEEKYNTEEQKRKEQYDKIMQGVMEEQQRLHPEIYNKKSGGN